MSVVSRVILSNLVKKAVRFNADNGETSSIDEQHCHL